MDLGCGIPVLGATHEVAQGADPAASAVYVDNDDVTVAGAGDLVRDDPQTVVIHADARDVRGILDHPRAAGLVEPTVRMRGGRYPAAWAGRRSWALVHDPDRSSVSPGREGGSCARPELAAARRSMLRSLIR